MKKLIPILILICGCNAAKRAVKSIDKGFRIDSTASAKRVQQIVPCITTKQDTINNTVTEVKYDTTEVVRDSLITLDCPDKTKISTVVKFKTQTVLKQTVVTNTQTITITKKDAADGIIIRSLQSEIKKQVGKKHFNFYWALIATGLLGLGIIVFLLGKSLNKKP